MSLIFLNHPFERVPKFDRITDSSEGNPERSMILILEKKKKAGELLMLISDILNQRHSILASNFQIVGGFKPHKTSYSSQTQVEQEGYGRMFKPTKHQKCLGPPLPTFCTSSSSCGTRGTAKLGLPFSRSSCSPMNLPRCLALIGCWWLGNPKSTLILGKWVAIWPFP